MTSQDTEALKALIAEWREAIDVEVDAMGNEHHPKHDCADDLERALERMLASQTQDMVLVPREPTEEMRNAGIVAQNRPLYTVTGVYRAMIAAAPVASQSEICGQDSVQPHQFEEHLTGLRWKQGMLVTNHDGEKWWLKACLNEKGERIGITDCCPETSPCEIHDRRAPAAGMDADKLAADIVEIYICTKGAKKYQSSVDGIAAIIRKHIP